MGKLEDQARAYAEIDNSPHDKSFFTAYEGFKAGAEWYSREIAKSKTGAAANAIKSHNQPLGSDLAASINIIRNSMRDLRFGGSIVGHNRTNTVSDLIRINNETLKVKFRTFLARIALANMSGTPIEDIEGEFDKLFNADGN